MLLQLRFLLLLAFHSLLFSSSILFPCSHFSPYVPHSILPLIVVLVL
jgi:hypothetical protein